MLKITLECISFTYRFKESFLFGLKLFFFSPNMQWTPFNFKKTGTVYRTASFSFPKWHWFESKSGWACNVIKDVFLFIHRFMWIFGYTNKHSQAFVFTSLHIFHKLPLPTPPLHSVTCTPALTKIWAAQCCFSFWLNKKSVLMMEYTLLSRFKMKQYTSLGCIK